MTTGIRTYAELWLLTATGACTALVGLRVMSVGTPHDALKPTFGTAASLLLHNAVVALWPLALSALRWNLHRPTRCLADVLVAGHLVAHGLLVGNALGQAPTLWRYLPHLPFEWLGIALPVAGWRSSRTEGVDAAVLRRLAGEALAALVVAAGLETWAVPL